MEKTRQHFQLILVESGFRKEDQQLNWTDIEGCVLHVLDFYLYSIIYYIVGYKSTKYYLRILVFS